MCLSLTPRALCESSSLHSPISDGESGSRSIFTSFLKLLDSATSGSHHKSRPDGISEMSPTSEEPRNYAHALPDEIQEGNLLYLLSNPLLLSLTADYLSPLSIVNLAATCRSFRGLMYGTPGVFRRLDLSLSKPARNSCRRDGQIWRNFQLNENMTEDESA